MRVTRTNARFETLQQLEEECEGLCAALARSRPKSALFDLRTAPGRNDAQFEAAIAPWRKKMMEPFNSIALLVTSAVGQLQVQRHMHADGWGERALVTIDEAAAIAFVSTRA